MPVAEAPAPTLPVRAPLPPVPAYRSDVQAADVPLLGGPVQGAPRRSVHDVRKPRRGRVLVAGATVVALAATAGAVVLLRGGGQAAPAPAAPTGARTQTTVVFALADPTGDEAALLAADQPNHSATVTLMPSRVVTNVPSGGQLPLGNAVAVPNAGTAAAAVSDLLHVTVDGTWRIDPGTLARLVDAVGGVQISVDRQITIDGVIVLNPGSQHVGGTAALQFAQYLASGEDESARLARVQAVLAGVLAGLPDDGQQIQDALGALGGGSVSSLPLSRLAMVLLQLRTATVAAAAPVFAILPVVLLDTGGGPAAYRVDPAGLTTYVAANLAASVPKAPLAGSVRVFVYNGTLDYGVGAAARTKLVASGLTFVGSGNDTSDSRTASVVLVRDDSPAARAQGLRVAEALGLPATSLQINPSPQDVSDVVVITGADFKL